MITDLRGYFKPSLCIVKKRLLRNWGQGLSLTMINPNNLKDPLNEKVLNELEKQLTLKGYTNKTKKAYIGHCRRFID